MPHTSGSIFRIIAAYPEPERGRCSRSHTASTSCTRRWSWSSERGRIHDTSRRLWCFWGPCRRTCSSATASRDTFLRRETPSHPARTEWRSPYKALWPAWHPGTASRPTGRSHSTPRVLLGRARMGT